MKNKACKIKTKKIENKLREKDGSNINKIDTNNNQQFRKGLKELIDKKAKGAQIRSRAKRD